jgi:hypothetical protein
MSSKLIEIVDIWWPAEDLSTTIMRDECGFGLKPAGILGNRERIPWLSRPVPGKMMIRWQRRPSWSVENVFLAGALSCRLLVCDFACSYEKTWWAALRLAHPTALFMVSGCPGGT